MNKQQIKQARVNAGFTQTKLAEILGVNIRQVQRWEAGDNIISPDLLVKLRIATGQISIDYQLRKYENDLIKWFRTIQ